MGAESYFYTSHHYEFLCIVFVNEKRRCWLTHNIALITKDFSKRFVDDLQVKYPQRPTLDEIDIIYSRESAANVVEV